MKIQLKEARKTILDLTISQDEALTKEQQQLAEIERLRLLAKSEQPKEYSSQGESARPATSEERKKLAEENKKLKRKLEETLKRLNMQLESKATNIETNLAGEGDARTFAK